jgi:ABC-type Zn uptake system ZnuABC Zn-binding protein ZnuA
MEVEQTFSPGCAGLAQGMLLELEPGEYALRLEGFAASTTPFLAGPAGGHHHDEGDPHFWLDPIHAIRYVENIRDGLIALDPAGKDTYTQNAQSYIVKLHDLDAYIQEQAAAIPEDRRLIVTNHESFGYFADRYGFKIIGTIVPSVSSGASPSAQQLARLIDHIHATGAMVIFLETGTNPELAEQVAAETGVQVIADLFTHSLSGPGGPAPTYIEMMKYNIQRIVSALGI